MSGASPAVSKGRSIGPLPACSARARLVSVPVPSSPPEPHERARAMNKPVDSWWTVLAIDPIAARLVPALSGVRAVTPTRLTLTAFVLGLASVVAFAAGELALGAILFEVRFLLDCLDGKLARYRGTSSPAGAFVDVACDMVVVGLCYGALVAALVADAGWERVPLVVGVSLVTAASWLQLYREAKHDDAARATSTSGGWLARHRLKSYPSSVEVETACLFLAPLLLGHDGIVAVVLAGYAFYALSIADSARRVYRRATAP
jgi:phosphatidylglycerophosphate synthase